MIADRNGMQFDIRELVWRNVLSQRCERGGVRLERRDARVRVKAKKRTDMPILLPQS